MQKISKKYKLIIVAVLLFVVAGLLVINKESYARKPASYDLCPERIVAITADKEEVYVESENNKVDLPYGRIYTKFMPVSSFLSDYRLFLTTSHINDKYIGKNNGKAHQEYGMNTASLNKSYMSSVLLSYLINDTHFSDDENEDDHFKQLLVLWAMDRLANFSDDKNYIIPTRETSYQSMETEFADLEDQVMELPKEESYQDKYNIYRGWWYEDEDNYAYEYRWKYLNALSAGDKELLKNSKYGDKMLSYLDTWEDYVNWYLDGQNVELDSITQNDISYYVTNDYVETKLITPKSTGKVYSDKFASYTVEVSSPMIVLDINGNEKKEFKAGEGFKVRIPLSEIRDKTINYSIKVKGNFEFKELLIYSLLRNPERYEMPSDSQVYLYQLLSTSAVTRNCSTTKTLKDDIELNFTQKVGDLNIKVIDTSTGNNLSKATVQIEDAKGNIVYRYETSEKDFNVTLPTGNYLVKQTVTPPNYEAITIQLRVSVEENGESSVVLENAPLVNVPDTNMNSYLFIIVGGLIAVAGGIIFGITFRKRRA